MNMKNGTMNELSASCSMNRSVLHPTKRNHRRRQKNSQKIYRSLFIFMMAVLLLIGVGRLVTVDASDQGNHEQPQIRYYTSISIEADDTLWNIAQEYNNGDESNSHYMNSIMNLNNMHSDVLYSGQNLLVYYYSDEIKQ